jgi:hypothetical protein
MFATPVAAGAAFTITPNVSSMVETLANEYSAAQRKAALLANFAATSASSAIKTAANDAAQVSADTYKFVTSADSESRRETWRLKPLRRGQTLRLAECLAVSFEPDRRHVVRTKVSVRHESLWFDGSRSNVAVLEAFVVRVNAASTPTLSITPCAREHLR